MDAYISGIAAMNIPCPDDTWGDGEFFLLIDDDELLADTAGDQPDCFVNTNEIFGREGIYECSEILREIGHEVEGGQTVYCANHYRAFCDLLVSHMLTDGESYLEPTDYFSTQAHLMVLDHWISRCELHLPPTKKPAFIQWRKNIQTRHSEIISEQ